MSILHQTILADHEKDGGLSLVKYAGLLVEHVSELFWFCLSFLLFIIMGPFSAVAVLIGLWSLAADDECGKNRIEPASI
jgi:hypothetical protein